MLSSLLLAVIPCATFCFLVISGSPPSLCKYSTGRDHHEYFIFDLPAIFVGNINTRMKCCYKNKYNIINEYCNPCRWKRKKI